MSLKRKYLGVILWVGLICITTGHTLCIHSYDNLSTNTEQPKDFSDFLKHLFIINLGEEHLEYFKNDDNSSECIISLIDINYNPISPSFELNTTNIFCFITIYKIFQYEKPNIHYIVLAAPTRGSPQLYRLS